jgi:nitronate monooxygenase
MNLRVSMEDEGAATSDAEAFERALSHLAPHLEAVGARKPQFSPYEPVRFEDQVRVLLDAKVPALSFIYGIPRKDVLEECHRRTAGRTERIPSLSGPAKVLDLPDIQK